MTGTFDPANLLPEQHAPIIVIPDHSLAPLPVPTSAIVAQAPQPTFDPGKLGGEIL